MIASNVLSRHSPLRSKNCVHVSSRLDAMAVTGKTPADIDITCGLRSRIEGMGIVERLAFIARRFRATLMCSTLSLLLIALILFTAFVGNVANASAVKGTRFDGCFEAAAHAYKVDARLLRAIARTESSMTADAVNRAHSARTKSVDIGLMQINSQWLPTLAKFGITEASLYSPCTNVSVGAWILKNLIVRHGATWNAVGAYNAACSQLKGDDCNRARLRYVSKVYAEYRADGWSVAAARKPSHQKMPPAARSATSVAVDSRAAVVVSVGSPILDAIDMWAGTDPRRD